MSKTIDGTELTKCFEAVGKAGREIDALLETINQEISSRLSGSSRYALVDRPKKTDDKSGWTCSMRALSYPVKQASKSKFRKAEGYLCFQVTTQGEEYFSGWSQPEALLHVCFWSDAIDNGQNCMALQLLDPETWRVENDSLVVWSDHAGSPKNWTFSLFLVDINSSEDVVRNIVLPAIDLLDGKHIKEVLQDPLKGFVKYEKEGDLLRIINRRYHERHLL